MLALAHPLVLPSAMLNDVGIPIAIISQLNTLPACTPVNASMAALRLATHDSGPGWIATPFPYDSFIHNSTPVYPGALSSLLGIIFSSIATRCFRVLMFTAKSTFGNRSPIFAHIVLVEEFHKFIRSIRSRKRLCFIFCHMVTRESSSASVPISATLSSPRTKPTLRSMSSARSLGTSIVARRR
jgi:hypothetical protein